MANERLIKGRIKSAKNIAQITKAMQMVSAAKMRRAQAAAVAGRPYAQKIAEAVSEFVKKVDPTAHPLLRKNEVGKELFILISTNKGLLGGLNANLFRFLSKTFSSEQLQNAQFITLGKKGEGFLVRTKRNLVADFSVGQPFSQSIPAVTKIMVDGYVSGEYKNVYLIYSNFISALNQEPVYKKLLPIAEFESNIVHAEDSKTEAPSNFLIEPSIESILDTLLSHYLENQLRDGVLEAEASEHSARMVAMKNATDNALELSKLLTLEYNKARQEKITYGIADIITARLAVEG